MDDHIRITHGAKMALRQKKAKVKASRKGNKAKYSRRNKKTVVNFLAGYDLLQYFIAVRPYVMQKYQIDLKTLEYLLYLYPYQYFTRKDYRNIPKIGMYYISLKSLIENGWVEVAVRNESGTDLLGFTDATHNCIKDLYEMLSGEKKIDVRGHKDNPFARDEASMLDQKRWGLLIKLREQATKRPSKFREALYRPVLPPEPSGQN